MTSTHQELRSIRSQLRTLRCCCLGLAALSILGPLSSFASRERDEIQDVIRAERLEIVEPDGQLSFVMANSTRPGAMRFDGEQQFSDGEERRQGAPSMIYYDSKGDEVGGMVLGTVESDEGFRTTRQLTLDAYKQDQTVLIKHEQSDKGAVAGMYISDRPTESMVDGIRALGFEPGASFRDVQKAMQQDDEKTRKILETYFDASQRVFIGSDHGVAKLALSDGQGRPRFVVSVPEQGPVSMKVLDEQGKQLKLSSMIEDGE